MAQLWNTQKSKLPIVNINCKFPTIICVDCLISAENTGLKAIALEQRRLARKHDVAYGDL
jgi:hypothetical protein